MTVLNPSFLFLLLPLGLFIWKSPKVLQIKIHSIILVFVIIALSRPVYKQSIEEMPIEAKELIIALDVSYSMNATDLQPTRYDFAKETIKALLKANPSDNVMLMAFTSNPLLLSPPTTDHRLISIALESLNPKFILTKGTSLKKLFQKLSELDLDNKNILLITDGGEEKDIQVLSSLILETKAHLNILALGSISGTSIAKEDGSLLKDKEGNLLISRINPRLKDLASSVLGTYSIASNTPQATAQELSNILQKQAQIDQEIHKEQRHYKELYYFPLLLALVLFFMLHTRFIKYLSIVFLLLNIPLEASFLDMYHLSLAYNSYKNQAYKNSIKEVKKIDEHSLQSQILLANSYYKLQEYKKAIKIYKSIYSTSIHIKQELFYNLGNSYAMEGKYTKAKTAYVKALQLGEDNDSLSNLRYIIFLEDKHSPSLGMPKPKSQNSASSKSENQDKKESKDENNPSSGSGTGGEKQKQKKKQKQKLQEDHSKSPHPLSSKVYELINKGYIYEKEPW